ncbi:hypothetical protein SAMD00019534_026440, partial [Acytostelium subglobosum LB1]|uniref:hypothetical protein n=1 Tax=Acytostelium subglobosum LB1 TaxID=1410327 RepID=UPI000644910C
MDTLPLTILRQIVECLDCNADRLMLSLSCKRLFEQRHSYLHFYIYGMPLYHNYNIDKVTLNSYKQIIDQVINNKPMTVFIYTNEMNEWSKSADRRILIAGDKRYSDEWKNEVLAMPSIECITFSECELCPLDEKFWEGTVDFFKALRDRYQDGSIPEIKFNQTSKPLQLHNIPITDIDISVDFNSNDDDELGGIIRPGMFPSTLTKLCLYNNHIFEPRIDLTYLRSLKTLYFSNREDQPLDGTELPASLTELELESRLGHINLNLPPSITDLAVYGAIRYRMDIRNPQTIRSISCYSASNISIKDYTNLREISFLSTNDGELSQLTSENLPLLECMYLGFKEVTMVPINLSGLPASLKRLCIKTQRRPIASLPSGIEWLRIHFDWFMEDVKLAGIVWPSPSLIRTLKLESYYYELTPDDIPSSVTCLKLLSHKKQVRHTALSPNIRKLLWYGGSREHTIELIQHLPMTIQRFDIQVGSELFNLRRIDSTLFIQIEDVLLRSGFIDLATLESLLASIKERSSSDL